jgi:hypothetical protein
MKRPITAALAAALALTPSLALAESKTLDVGSFHGVDVSSGIRAVVSGGQPQSVVAEAADAKDIADLRYEVRDGILHLWYDFKLAGIFDWSGRDITVTIGTELLDALEASAGASVEATGLMGEEISLEASSGASLKTGPIEGMAYSLEASSGARIETSGLCTSAQIESSSGASIAAKDLACATVSVEISSGASVEVAAKDSISADISSGGHATIFGKPSVESLETSSGGSIDFRE